MINFDTISHYQFSFFSPNSRVEASPQIISSFMTAFAGTEFMPTTVPEFHIGPVSETRQQLQFITANSAWRIEFEPHRIAFTKATVPGAEIGTPEDFKNAANDYCARVLSVLELKSNRFSFITKGFLPEMETAKLQQVYSKLLNPPKFYSENESIEWATRNAASFMSDKFKTPEKYNVITDINCVRIIIPETGMQKESTRIEIGFDINTNHKNTQQRFKARDVEPFLSEAIELSAEILSEIEESIL